MQIQKVNSNQNHPNFNGLLKVSENLTLIPEQILTGVDYGPLHNGRFSEEGHYILCKSRFGETIAIQLKKVNDELLAKIAKARSSISDTVEDISAFVEKLIDVTNMRGYERFNRTK